MREIKFRGRDASTFENAGWVYGFLVMRYAPYVNTEFTERIGTAECPYIVRTEETLEPQWTPVSPNTVGQYTGLKDKNGREIYEGDVVATVENGCRYVQEVAWSDAVRDRPGFLFRGHGCGPVFHDASHMEVIGNIHDNPELVDRKEFEV